MKNLLVTLLAVIGICYTTASFAQAHTEEVLEENTIILDDKNHEGETSILVKDGKLYVDGKKVADIDKRTILKIVKKNTMSQDASSFFKRFDMPFEFPMEKSFYIAPQQKVLLGVATENANPGVKINKVVEGSAAEEAGLKVGDIITSIDDEDIEDYEDLVETIASHEAGETVQIDVNRNDELRKMVATLKPNKTNKMSMQRSWDLIPKFNTLEDAFNLDSRIFRDVLRNSPQLGLEIEETESGLEVTSIKPNSAAQNAGIKKGDRIKTIEDVKINTLEDMTSQLMQKRDAKKLNFGVQRDGAIKTLPVVIPRAKKRASF